MRVYEVLIADTHGLKTVIVVARSVIEKTGCLESEFVHIKVLYHKVLA